MQSGGTHVRRVNCFIRPEKALEIRPDLLALIEERFNPADRLLVARERLPVSRVEKVEQRERALRERLASAFKLKQEGRLQSAACRVVLAIDPLELGDGLLASVSQRHVPLCRSRNRLRRSASAKAASSPCAQAVVGPTRSTVSRAAPTRTRRL